MHNDLYPLVFRPLLQRLVWGGRKLASLGKPLPAGEPIGESWELVDLPNAQSILAHGALAGRTLHELVQRRSSDLLGPVALDGGRFPLLVKYIDAAQTLSVQVHPDEQAAQRMGRGRPKNEAWCILDVEPGARLYVGLQPGTDAARLQAALRDGSIEELLVPIDVRPGDLVPIRPGTVHAIGAGVLLAEVQQPSDTTYRVYDWGRVGLDGKPRPLHVEEALQCARLDARAEIVRDELDAGHFRAHLLALAPGQRRAISGTGPRVLVGLAGDPTLRTPNQPPLQLPPGRVALVPHVCQETALEAQDTTNVLLVTFSS